MASGVMKDKQNAYVIYTDFAKAFDKCDHGIIALKMRSKGISGKVGRWIFNFLADRTQSVIVSTVKSRSSTVKSLVPQGTVLAPVLLFILISDIDKDTNYSTVSSSADDISNFMIVDNIKYTANFQFDVNRAFQ
ncbi:uncharacterized protein [Procambarus clarkii]|uniref:uncharacterized protein n=1 Tax=Procambarus clarkii TaxID=6728 RepID=UPI003742279D